MINALSISFRYILHAQKFNFIEMKNKKLCDWNKTEIKDAKSKMLSIVKAPAYYCKKCVRVASEDSYLCKPEKIKL